MAIISPTITAENKAEYAKQMAVIEPFAQRVHIDLMDGKFTKNQSVILEDVWWPGSMRADVHMMFDHPEEHLAAIKKLRPDLVVIHAEAKCDVVQFAKDLKSFGLRTGLAIFPKTSVSSIAHILPYLHQVLIFSGNLGYQGGSVADLKLLKKVEEIRKFRPDIPEIAWDGGVNDQNAHQLVEAGIDVLNTGGFIHHAANPAAAFAKLQDQISQLDQ